MGEWIRNCVCVFVFRSETYPRCLSGRSDGPAEGVHQEQRDGAETGRPEPGVPG